MQSRPPFRRLWTEGLLINDALLVDDESHYPGVAVAPRPGDHAETADHAPVHDVVARPARRRRALRIEQAEIVAIMAVGRLAVGLRLGDSGPERALRLPPPGPPTEPPPP